MKSIEFTDAVSFGDTAITGIKVQPISFVSFVTIWRQAANEGQTVAAKITASINRKRIKHQVHFSAADGKRVVPDDLQIASLPIGVAKSIVAELDAGNGQRGEMLNDGDGGHTPAHYKLGNPIEVELNKQKTVITELEFQAKTYGDIEDVLATDGDLPQALELLRKVARPVGFDSFSTLPSWALEKISLADGAQIAATVLPRFLG